MRVEEGFRAIADDAVRLPGRNQPNADIPRLMYSWLSKERNRNGSLSLIALTNKTCYIHRAMAAKGGSWRLTSRKVKKDLL